MPKKVKVYPIGQTHSVCHHFKSLWDYIEKRKKLGKCVIICQEGFSFNSLETSKKNWNYQDLKNKWKLEDSQIKDLDSFKNIAIKKINEEEEAYHKKNPNQQIKLFNTNYDLLTQNQKDEINMLFMRAKFGERYYVDFLEKVSENKIPFFTLNDNRWKWKFEKIKEEPKDEGIEEEVSPDLLEFMKEFNIIKGNPKDYLKNKNDEIIKYTIYSGVYSIWVKSVETNKKYRIDFKGEGGISDSLNVSEGKIVEAMAENLHYIAKKTLEQQKTEDKNKDIEIFVVQLGKLHNINLKPFMNSSKFKEMNKENIEYDIRSFALTIETEKKHTLDCYRKYLLEDLEKHPDNILNTNEFKELRKTYAPLTISYDNFIKKLEELNKDNKEICKKEFEEFHQQDYFKEEDEKDVKGIQEIKI